MTGPKITIDPLPEVFLGDGLYAAFDGYSIRLRVPREDGDHIVYLEPITLTALTEFVKETKRRGEKDEG